MAGTQISRDQGRELASNPGFVLESNAAKAWDRSVAAFGKLVLLTGAWRSYETQEHLFDGEKYPNEDPQYGRYSRGNRAGQRGYTNDVRWWPAKGSYWTRKEGSAAAAVPGTSNHGSGRAVDVKTRRDPGDPGYDTHVIFAGWNDEDRKRFLRVAAEHGWYDDEGESVGEHWHLTYYPERDQHRGEAVPTPPKKETFLMGLSDSKQNELADDANAAAERSKRIEEAVGGKVLEGPYDGPKSKQKEISLARAARLTRLVTTETRDSVKALRAEVRGLRTAVETMAKGLKLDPERVYEMLDKHLAEATSDLKITFEAEARDEEADQ